MTETDERLPSSGFFIAVVFLECCGLIFGIFGNTGVIMYNVFMKHAQNPTTYFIANLAIADMLLCCTCFPGWMAMHVQFIIATVGYQKFKRICQICLTSSYAGVALSLANLLAITVDRFLFITRPLKYPLIMTWPKTYLILVLIWLSAIINVIILAFYTQDIEDMDNLYCATDLSSTPMLLFSVLNFYLPITVLVFVNYKIFKIARRQRRRITVTSMVSSSTDAPSISTGRSQFPYSAVARRGRMQQLKVIKTFAIVLGIFLLSCIPFVLIRIADNFICDYYCVSFSLYTLSGVLLGTNSVFNPFIYGIRHKEYRNAYRQFFFKLCSNMY